MAGVGWLPEAITGESAGGCRPRQARVSSQMPQNNVPVCSDFACASSPCTLELIRCALMRMSRSSASRRKTKQQDRQMVRCFTCCVSTERTQATPSRDCTAMLARPALNKSASYITCTARRTRCSSSKFVSTMRIMRDICSEVAPLKLFWHMWTASVSSS